MKYFSILLSLILLFVACSRNESRTGFYDDVLITQLGIYSLKNGWKVTVEQRNDDILEYRVVDGSNKEMIRSQERPSALQMWKIFWEAGTARLWVNSSDIGTFVWRAADGVYRETVLQGDEGGNPMGETKNLVSQMPQTLFSALPGTIQRNWTKFRKMEPTR